MAFILDTRILATFLATNNQGIPFPGLIKGGAIPSKGTHQGHRTPPSSGVLEPPGHHSRWGGRPPTSGPTSPTDSWPGAGAAADASYPIPLNRDPTSSQENSAKGTPRYPPGIVVEDAVGGGGKSSSGKSAGWKGEKGKGKGEKAGWSSQTTPNASDSDGNWRGGQRHQLQ